ncbi:MAG: hypothetical protein ACFCU6_16345 [Balneolaceae bacterium]
MIINSNQYPNCLNLLFAAVSLLLTLSVSTAAVAQEPADPRLLLDRLVQENSHEISFSDGKLTGPGIDPLLESLHGSQFLAFSESHGNREQPAIVGALFPELQERFGYNYLVVENGPFIMEKINEPGIRGNATKIAEIAVRYPISIHMNFAEELEMIALIGEMSKAEGPAVWGVDQATGALHLLDLLLDSAPGEEAAAFLRQIRKDAAEMELMRFKVPMQQLGRAAFLGVHADVERYQRLKELYRPEPGSKEEKWIDALILTSRIYAGQQGRPPGAYVSNFEREQWMKQQFLEHYQNAKTKTGEKPNVILKLGHNHLVRGFNNTNILSLGNFISEFAVYNGSHSVHIYVHPVSEDPGSLYHQFLGHFASLTGQSDTGGLTLIDLKPFRKHPVLNRLPEFTDAIRDLVNAWDFLMVIGNSTLSNPDDVPRLAGEI